MPTLTEQAYAQMMLSSLSHAEPGQRIYCGANAGGIVSDGEIISQRSTYPKWYGKLCLTEAGEAIRQNLERIALGKENRRAGVNTKGWTRVMKAVQYVMAEGDDTGLIWPDPTFLHELGRHEEAESVAAYVLAKAEAAADQPDEPTPPAPLREEDSPIPARVRAAIPLLAAYCSSIEVRGWFVWPTPLNEECKQALLKAGYSVAVKEGKVYGPPEHARRLPSRLCHSLPSVSVTPYH